MTKKNTKATKAVAKKAVKKNAKAATAINPVEVAKSLRSLLKQTNSPQRIKRVESHLTEVTATDLNLTRIGSALAAFKKVNKSKNITSAVVSDFLHARLLQACQPKAASAVRLSEQGFVFDTTATPFAL